MQIGIIFSPHADLNPLEVIGFGGSPGILASPIANCGRAQEHYLLPT
jgi:hypothetical protein